MQTNILNVDSIELFILLFVEREELKLRYYILFLLVVFGRVRALNKAMWAAEVH